MQPLVAAWAHAFEHVHPELRVSAPKSTRYSAAGVSALLSNRANCVTFAREPFPAEAAALRQRFQRGPILIPVAGGSYATAHGTFALAIYVNRANPLRRLSLDQLSAVLSGTARTRGPAITDWGQLGLHGRWQKRPVHVYGMTPKRASGNPPGIVNFLNRRVLHRRPWRRNLRVEVDSPKRSALQAIVQHIAADPDGIGYSGFSYASGAVRALALSAGSEATYYKGTPENVASAHYPLARQIYLGFGASRSTALPPSICAFVTFVLSREGQRLIEKGRMRFEPLTSQQKHRALWLLERTNVCGRTTQGPQKGALASFSPPTEPHYKT